MTDERVKALDEIGFPWTRTLLGQKSFESRLADLRRNKQQQGHLNAKQAEDQSLFNFCNNVRYGSFEDRLEELRRYKHLHGHTNVRWADDIPLAAFCSKVRFARKTGRTGRLGLTDARIAALDSLGFDDWF